MWALKQEKSDDSGNENQQRLGYLLDGEQQRQRHCGNERGRQVNHSPLAENEGRTSDGSDGRSSDPMHKSLYLLVQIGRASCRERVKSSEGAGAVKKRMREESTS